jgi:hypothetical protein
MDNRELNLNAQDNKVDRFASDNFSIEIDEEGDIKIKIKPQKT